MNTVAIASPPQARSRAGWLVAWALFWVLMATVSLQDHLRDVPGEWWKPLLWEGTSCLVASVILSLLWRQHRGRPLADAAGALVRAAAGLAAAVRAGLRDRGLRAAPCELWAAGQSYTHAGWGPVYLYECTKFSLFFMLFVAIVFGVRTHAALAEQRLRTQAAQLAQLTQQLEPHFLFNALNTIASTIHGKPDLADSLLTRLAALLRAAADLTRRPSCTLDEELRLVDGYAAIMCERFADRVSLRVDIDPTHAPAACRRWRSSRCWKTRFATASSDRASPPS